jgi:hypothetical protein
MTWCKHVVIGLILFAILLYGAYRLEIRVEIRGQHTYFLVAQDG